MPKGRGMANLLRNVERQMNEEHDKQDRILRAAALITMHRHWGWRQKRLLGLLEMIDEVISECGDTRQKSMIQMLDEETGIELQNGDGKSWRDVAYLNGSINPGMMNEAQWLYMRQQQVKWIRPQVMACIMVSLHRKYGFGYDRCARIYQQIQDILDEHGNNPERIRKACLQETGINVVDVVTGNDS